MYTHTSFPTAHPHAIVNRIAISTKPRLLAALMLLTVVTSKARAVEVLFSLADNINNTIANPTLAFNDGDIVEYDSDTNTASIFFAEATITPNPDIDAFHLLPNGHILLSVLFNGRTLGGLTFDDGDLVKYDPVNDTASIYFLQESDFTLATGGGDINAVTVRPDGNIVFALTATTTTFRGTAYLDGDLVEYNPNTNTATRLLAEATVCDDGDCDLDGVHILSNGHYVISFFDDETISGVAFLNADFIDYDPVNDTASLFLSESVFTDEDNGHNLDAIYVIEQTGFPLGDMNCDGNVDFNDAAPFAQALIDPAGYLTTFPDCDIANGDINASSGTDGADINAFIECVLAGGCP